jgi:glycosyltransferase involved in cell wall biosynthesis
MRILLLSYEYPPLGGGAGVAMQYLLRGLSQTEGLAADLVTSAVDRHHVEHLEGEVAVHYLDIGKAGSIHYQTNRELLAYSVKSYMYARRLLRQHHYDLVHAFFGIPSGYIASKLPLPYIVSLRGSDVPFYNKRFERLDRLFFKRMSRRVWQRAAFVVANSEGLKALALESSPTQEIGVVYNGVDTDRFRPGRIAPKKGKRRVIVSTGRLIERKGYQFLIEALRGVDDFELQLVGDGNMGETLRAMASDLGVPVNLLGKKTREEIVPILQAADIFVLPSLNEGMSNALLEAIACGLPVVVTDVGGSRELVKDNGFVVEKGSPKALRKALLEYQGNPALVKSHRKASRKKALTMSWQKMSHAYVALYEKVVQGRS